MNKESNERSIQSGLVSVIIPVYKSERFIGETLDSVLAQTYKQIEIIIINDASPDNSDTIIQRYVSNSDNIRYYIQPQNGGVAAARNKGISCALGQYIAFVDSDDIWDSKKIEKQIALMEKNPNAPICYTAIQIIDEKGQIIKGKRNVAESIGYHRLLHNTMIATSSVVINRNIVPVIKMPNRKSCEDYSLWLELTRKYAYCFGMPPKRFKLSRNRKSFISRTSYGV